MNPGAHIRYDRFSLVSYRGPIIAPCLLTRGVKMALAALMWYVVVSRRWAREETKTQAFCARIASAATVGKAKVLTRGPIA